MQYALSTFVVVLSLQGALPDDKPLDIYILTRGEDVVSAFALSPQYNRASHEVDASNLAVAGVDDDGNGTTDDAAPQPPFEPGWAGSDDVELNLEYPNGYNNWPSAWPLPDAFPGTWNDPGGGDPGENWLSPIETEAVRHANDEIDEHDYADQDWGDPGKQHEVNEEWDN